MQYSSRFLRQYARWKTLLDPAYAAVFAEVRDSTSPIVDLGCGIGLLAVNLRKRGYTGRIIGIDHDEWKIRAARDVAGDDRTSFALGDMRAPIPERGNVVMLDVLHYFTHAEQDTILRNALDAVAPGQALMIREGLRDQSISFRITRALEVFAKKSGWLQAERLNFPTRESLSLPVPPSFRAESRRLSRLPLNNFFFVFRAPDVD